MQALRGRTAFVSSDLFLGDPAQGNSLNASLIKWKQIIKNSRCVIVFCDDPLFVCGIRFVPGCAKVTRNWSMPLDLQYFSKIIQFTTIEICNCFKSVKLFGKEGGNNRKKMFKDENLCVYVINTIVSLVTKELRPRVPGAK